MKIQALLFAVTASITLASLGGCGNSSTGAGGTGGTSSGGTGGTGGSSAIPDVPKLGEQVDRFGRPAINTALNHTFDANPEAKDAAKDKWNANKTPADWSAYVPEIEANLAILDGIDTVCGNQLGADMTKMDATRYAFLAGVLADDRLYLNVGATSSTVYLAVEANAVKALENSDGGGRPLAADVIDASYTVLAAGKLDGSIGDKVPVSDAAKASASFPYLNAPH